MANNRIRRCCSKGFSSALSLSLSLCSEIGVHVVSHYGGRAAGGGLRAACTEGQFLKLMSCQVLLESPLLMAFRNLAFSNAKDSASRTPLQVKLRFESMNHDHDPCFGDKISLPRVPHNLACLSPLLPKLIFPNVGSSAPTRKMAALTTRNSCGRNNNFDEITERVRSYFNRSSPSPSSSS